MSNIGLNYCARTPTGAPGFRQIGGRARGAGAPRGYEKRANRALDPGDRLARPRRAQNCDSRTPRIVRSSSRLPILEAPLNFVDGGDTNSDPLVSVRVSVLTLSGQVYKSQTFKIT